MTHSGAAQEKENTKGPRAVRSPTPGPTGAGFSTTLRRSWEIRAGAKFMMFIVFLSRRQVPLCEKHTFTAVCVCIKRNTCFCKITTQACLQAEGGQVGEWAVVPSPPPLPLVSRGSLFSPNLVARCAALFLPGLPPRLYQNLWEPFVSA